MYLNKNPNIETTAFRSSLRFLNRNRNRNRKQRKMDHFGGGGNWAMIPNIQSHSNPTTPSSQDHLFLQQQQFNQQQQFQQQFNQQQQPLRFQQQQTPPPPQQQPQQQHQSLASHFHLLHVFIHFFLNQLPCL